MVIKKIKKMLLKIIASSLLIFTLYTPVFAGQKVPTIILDYAHHDTIYDYGATYEGYKESEIANDITEKVGEVLEEKGFNVLYTRDKDGTITINERVEFAKENYYDSYISIHVNSAANPAHGSESYSNNCWSLSNSIGKEIALEFNIPHRGVKTTPFYNIYIPNSTILELGFINGDTDMLVNHQDKLVEIITDAIIEQYLK